MYDLGVTVCDFSGDTGCDAMIEMDRFLTTKGVCSAEILVFVLLDQFAYLRCSFWGGVGVLQPGFEGHSLTSCKSLLNFQSASGKEGQEFAERQRAGMGGVTKLLKAVVVGSASGKLTHDEILDHDSSLQMADPSHFGKHSLRVFTVMK